MKQFKNWKNLLVLALVLALALTVPLQANEAVDAAETEEAVILGSNEVSEPASEEPDTPAPISSLPEVIVEGKKEVPTSSVPENARTNSEPAENGQEASQKDSTPKKTVRFYLDWNGIDGLFGHCLTCTREFAADATPVFTAQDAAVYGLNFLHAYDAEFEVSEDKWGFLAEKWAQETPYGYEFLGWSTEPTGGTLITSDTEVTDGMSIYAHWKKGDESNETFQRIDPAAGPLEAIRILAGAGTQFNSGTLHAGKHAAKGESFTLDLFYTPVRAVISDITWDVKVYEEVSPLSGAFRPGQAAETMTVEAGKEATSSDGGVTVKAEGCRLTVTNTDGGEHTIVVSVTAKGVDGQEVRCLSDATLGFSHSWDQGSVTKEANCTEKGSVHYTCTVCGTPKDKDIPALEHVYNKSKSLNTDSNTYYEVKVIKPATCTEEGENEYTYKCLRCGEYSQPEKGKVPALGHAWTEIVKAPASCNQDTETRSCTRCGLQEVSLVPAYHPELHVWKETYRYHETCMSDYLYEKCEVCGETRSRTEAADNPDCHSYAYESSVRNDCYWVTYTFRCVHGCGSAQVTLKREEGHSWSGWTTSASMDRTTGMMMRVRTRTCSRCGKKETENLDSVPVSANNVAAVGNSAPVSQPVSYTAGKDAAVAKVASPGKAGWKTVGKKKYYLDKNGRKKTGWKRIDGKKYYFGKNGVMQTGWKTIKGRKYYFGKDGVMRTGKQKIGKKTYVFGKNGVLK